MHMHVSVFTNPGKMKFKSLTILKIIHIQVQTAERIGFKSD